jgi:aspartyl-tRNA(Asn)/glutamyl-tRNA(Gln) amidotransferase subunit C
MQINDELLSKLATLARIDIDDSKKEKMKKDLSEIISWMEKLQEVDTTGVEPLTNMSREINRWREDNPGEPMDRSKALDNAPRHDNKFFKVPKVLKNK